ncbi:unnamed protein product [Leptosia nina]|uniref:Uncharacterized protein n=1 Tax=Leptosia nina TaxID=320188 RepID=A0AAV1JX50_9NEOP
MSQHSRIQNVVGSGRGSHVVRSQLRLGRECGRRRRGPPRCVARKRPSESATCICEPDRAPVVDLWRFS